MAELEDFTVGWISAVWTEYVAARQFFDEMFDDPEKPSTDHNEYTLGRIGKHNVVVTLMTKGTIGSNSAAIVARDMLHLFPNIRVCLMVGIGGGVPSKKHDIRLGDVVVSMPVNGLGGVFQSDFGKNVQGKPFQFTGLMDRVPDVLISAVYKLRTRYAENGHTLADTINTILSKNKRLQKAYASPRASTDILYHASYQHSPSQDGDGPLDDCSVSCSQDPTVIIQRRAREDYENNPEIHYGTIASGNQVIKDAVLRDALAREKDILCFEMEAAGLMNQVPCLVIRGICDYADSHKSKSWQGYAAMVASAYAKELLSVIRPTALDESRKLQDMILLTVKDNLQEVSGVSHDTHTMVKALNFDRRLERIKRWLDPPDPSINLNKAQQTRSGTSGSWFLNGEAFQRWKTTSRSFLWLQGIPGCGKTVLSSSAVTELLRADSSCNTTLYFFFDFTEKDMQTLGKLVRSLIYQLYCKSEGAQKYLYELFINACNEGASQLNSAQLHSCLSAMLREAKEAWIVIDGLDECTTRKGRAVTENILACIRDLSQREDANTHFLVTSRPEHEIGSDLGEWTDSETQWINIQNGLVQTYDINAYIRKRVIEEVAFSRWKDRVDVQQMIITALTLQANGMFRWVVCQLDTLRDCLDFPEFELRETLDTLPKTLYETYGRILSNIKPQHINVAIRILQFLTFDQYASLSPEEIVDMIAANAEAIPGFLPENTRLPNSDQVIEYCSSLVTIVEQTDRWGKPFRRVQLAHFSVKEYFLSSSIHPLFAAHFAEIRYGRRAFWRRATCQLVLERSVMQGSPLDWR
ncbi:purine and uridine phosphorylase [Ascobolus immersus RN42]|uniref:Purine and uridine phosphorylase n=1 Tax=Ascobolus immersus RN42 TaxID=1160509 RepID=A0A3N4HNR0_ASCIM|nr:purine and uridine phosphorylase [Ascobolus immersus RN42]